MEIFTIFIEALGLGKYQVGARSSELLVEFTEIGNLEPRPPPNQVFVVWSGETRDMEGWGQSNSEGKFPAPSPHC